MSTTSETNAMIDYLNLRGCYVWRNQTIGKVRGQFYVNKRGVADIVGISPSGRHLEVEVKIGKDVMSLAQKNHADKVRANRGIYIVARSLENLISQWIAISSDTEVSRVGDQKPHLVPVRQSKQPTPTGNQ